MSKGILFITNCFLDFLYVLGIPRWMELYLLLKSFYPIYESAHIYIYIYIYGATGKYEVTLDEGCMNDDDDSQDPPEITLETSRDHWYLFSLFSLDFFSPLATNMDPYGPVWTRMDPYIIIYCFYMILDGFIHDFWDFSTFLKTHFTHCLSHS